MSIKKHIKRCIKEVLKKSRLIRKVVYALNRIAQESDNAAFLGTDSSIFTDKALYSGSSVDYLNHKFLTKEERSSELKRIFYNNCKYYLDLENPKTFNQKLQWLKINYYDPDMSRCVDKAEFKEYIKEQIGEGYTVPMYACWQHENHMDFSKLPDRFVLKSNVQSDGRHIIVVNDKSKVDMDKLKTLTASWLLRRNNLCSSYCNAYHNVQPKIIAEEYISGIDDNSLIDYKFMCFNGEAKMLFVVVDREKRMGVNFYDLDWNLLPFTRKYPNSASPVKKPKNFEKMLEIANKLAKPFPFVRIDFYESADGSKVYVGEMTFYPGGGYEQFSPIEWDYKLGDMINLPEQNI